MNTTSIKTLSAAVIGLSLLFPAVVLGQTGAAAGATVQAQTTGANVTVSAAVMTRAKEKAGKEIDRRIAALNSLLTRVNSMTKINEQLQTNLQTFLQGQTTALAQLKVQIEADTDGAKLRTDIQTITQSYRTFALIIPQARIIAASDRIVTMTNILIGIGNKLQTRLQAAQNAGADITALGVALTDMGTKIDSANAHAQAAVTGTVNLTPDDGDKTKLQENEAALKKARTELTAAHADIVAARKDITTIINGLKNLKVNASASSTLQTP